MDGYAVDEPTFLSTGPHASSYALAGVQEVDPLLRQVCGLAAVEQADQISKTLSKLQARLHSNSHIVVERSGWGGEGSRALCDVSNELLSSCCCATSGIEPWISCTPGIVQDAKT